MIVRHTGLKSVITEFALALLGMNDEQWIPSGTAIVVAPHLAIAAKHVITHYFERLDRQPIPNNEPGESLMHESS